MSPDTAVEPVQLERRSADGTVLGQVTLDPSVYSLAVNVPLVHQVVTAQLAGRRAGTQSTKTRAEVRGGSAKPFRQKGTGNARQGSIRAPHYSGGGIALGPKPRSYAQKTPRKMIQQALRCALSDRAREGSLRLLDQFSFDVPKTKDAVALLSALGADGRVLIVHGRGDETAVRSFANLAHVTTVPVDQLTAYDVLCADSIVFTDATLIGDNTESDAAPARRPRATRPRTTAAASPAPEATEAEGEQVDAPDSAQATEAVAPPVEESAETSESDSGEEA